jgi:hypothetical protein
VSKNTAILLSVFILTPFFTILGCIAGYTLYGYQLEPHDTWKDLGSPPIKVRQLLAADTATIYVRTIDGRIFSCYRESQYDQDCWNEVDTVPPVWEHDPSCPGIKGAPSEPNGVIERLVTQHCIDAPVYTGNHMFSYILLADGTVMQWISEPIGYFAPPNQIRQFGQKVFGGCLMGILCSTIFSLLLFWFRSPTSSPR